MNQPSNEVLRLVALLRNQDQLIFRMSQCGSWEQMRPIFQTLLVGTMERMREESDRIRTLMIPEIRKAYLNAAETHQAEDRHPRLEGPRDASAANLETDRGDDRVEPGKGD